MLHVFISPLLQAVMPSPVLELRGPTIKHYEASFLEDYTFQQTTPYIHALRDPVCNRVTLVGFLLATVVTRSGLMCSWFKPCFGHRMH